MPPKPRADLFVSRLDELIDMRRSLVRLTGLIDWAEIESVFVHFHPGGRLALSPRLLCLQHTFNVSNATVACTWLENPCWQYFAAS